MVASRKFFFSGALALLIASLFCGCVTQSEADARVKAAYIAGQKAAYVATGADPDKIITVDGPVRHAKVPWVVGLTLVQAIATADYTGRHNPKAITITRHGQSVSVEPNNWLHGQVVLLEPGDAITLLEVKPVPKPEPRTSK